MTKKKAKAKKRAVKKLRHRRQKVYLCGITKPMFFRTLVRE